MLNKDAKIDIKCPKCESSFSISVKQLQSGEIITCPNCQVKLDTKEAQKALREVENKLKNLPKSLSKTININFKL